MANATSPNREQHTHNYYSNAENLANDLTVAIQDGVDLISLIVSAKAGKLPQSHPKNLKTELSTRLTNPSLIESVNFTRQAKLILTTKNILTAQEILAFDNLLGVPVTTYIQTETISSRFLLRLDCSVSCADIAAELTEQGHVVYEIRRFTRKISDTPQPTTSVLVTCLGTSLPSEVKLWYEVHRISPFFDKPRACLKCHRFNHSTKMCRSTDSICVSCATSHTGDCTSPTPLCINCKAAHPANDKACPHYLQEARLQKFRSENHLTIREARRQFTYRPVANKTSYAMVADSTPPDTVTKADLDNALRTMSTHFTTMLQAVVTEFQKSMQDMVESVTRPLLSVIEQLQAKQPNKASLAGLQDILEKRAKKPKITETINFNVPSSLHTSTPMDIQTPLLDATLKGTPPPPNSSLG